MKMVSKAVLLTGVLALAACSSKNDFTGNDEGFNDPAPVTGPVADGPSDPNSIAYFQQAVGDRVLFEVDQSTLSDAGRSVLEAQSRWLLDNSDYTAIIEGHADEQGTREYNVALGARRANAVRDYLVDRGIAGSRLRVLSYGKERPIEICSEESCYAKNRRAVTVLAGGLSS